MSASLAADPYLICWPPVATEGEAHKLQARLPSCTAASSEDMDGIKMDSHLQPVPTSLRLAGSGRAYPAGILVGDLVAGSNAVAAQPEKGPVARHSYELRPAYERS